MKSRLAVLMAKQDPPMSQRELAEKSGVSAMAINRLYRNDFKRVDTETLEKLCDFFRCDLSDLLILKEVGKGNVFPPSDTPSSISAPLPSPPSPASKSERIPPAISPDNIPPSAYPGSKRRKKQG